MLVPSNPTIPVPKKHHISFKEILKAFLLNIPNPIINMVKAESSLKKTTS